MKQGREQEEKKEKGGRNKKKKKRPEILEVNAAGAVRVLEFYLALKYIRGRRRWRSVCVCMCVCLFVCVSGGSREGAAR